jgi:hypothetical protein
LIYGMERSVESFEEVRMSVMWIVCDGIDHYKIFRLERWVCLSRNSHDDSITI